MEVQLTIEFCGGGPMDGFACDFNSKKVPSKVQFGCTSKYTGSRFAVYQYEPAKKQYRYVASFLEDQKINFRDDCLARPYLEIAGEGTIWKRWITVTELQEGQSGG